MDSDEVKAVKVKTYWFANFMLLVAFALAGLSFLPDKDGWKVVVALCAVFSAYMAGGFHNE